MRSRTMLIVLTVLSLLLTGCSLLDSSERTEWSGRVGAEVQRVELGRAVVIFPKGVAPAGTRATVKVTSVEDAVPSSTVSLSPAVEITLEGDLQPAAPVQITVPLDEDGPGPSTVASQFLLFGSATGSDGTEQFLTGTYDQTSNTFSMTADHFSSFRILGIDVGKAMGEVRTAIMQGLGLEWPAPACTDKAVEVAGSKYEVTSYPEAHLCLSNDDGNLVITAHPAIGMPYLVTTAPKGRATTTPAEVSVSTSGIVVFAEALGLTGGDSVTGLFPGVSATLALDGAPEAVRIGFRQEPGLLLMVILARTLDVLGLTSIEALGNLQCLADVGGTNSSLADGLSGESVGAFAKAFFTCAGSVPGLSSLGKFLLAAIGTAPGLLVTSVIGIINEIAGTDRRSVDLLVTPPIRPANQALLNSVLPGDVCWTGDMGWSAKVPIQLVDGAGAAYESDGTFADVGIIGTEVLGWADLNADGRDEVVLALQCAGSPPETCCAGRSSNLLSVAVLTPASDNRLEKVAPTLMGGASGPGDEYGPADRQIIDAQLRGDTVITTESIIYPEHYTSDQVGGDPYGPVTVEYRLAGDGWRASRP